MCLVLVTKNSSQKGTNDASPNTMWDSNDQRIEEDSNTSPVPSVKDSAGSEMVASDRTGMAIVSQGRPRDKMDASSGGQFGIRNVKTKLKCYPSRISDRNLQSGEIAFISVDGTEDATGPYQCAWRFKVCRT